MEPVLDDYEARGELPRVLIERIASSEWGVRLRGDLAQSYPGVPPDWVEDAFQEACLRGTVSCRARSVRKVYAFLRTTAANLLVDRTRRDARAVYVSDVDPVVAVGGGGGVDPLEVCLEREDREEVLRAARAVVGRLSPRQREIVALHARGRRRPQIARHLGMSERTVKRQLERIFEVGRDELLGLAASRGCEEGRRQVGRLAFGLSSAAEVGETQLHLLGCSDCALLYERLQDLHARVAVLVPLPGVRHVDASVPVNLVERAADAFADRARDVVDVGAGVYRQLSTLPGHAKHHAASAYYRAVDPTPLAGVRPGAAVAVVASCLAAGGGAFVCVKEGVAPLVPSRDDRPPKVEKDPVARKVRAAPQPPAPPVVAPQAETSPAPAPATQPRTTDEPPAPPPTPADEIYPETPEETEPRVAEVEPRAQASTSSATQPANPTPASAPSSGPGEFQP